MLHCYPCGYLPAGEACSSIRWAGMLLCELALSRLLLAHPPPGGRTCLRCKLVPSNAPAGRLRVRANLNNRTMRAALAGWGARCLYESLVAGPALAAGPSWGPLVGGWACACAVASELQRASCTLVGSNPTQSHDLAL